MNCRLLLISLLTITTMHASDSDSEQSSLAKEIAVTRAGICLLIDAATRLTHLEETVLQQQLELQGSDEEIAKKLSELEKYSDEYKKQFEAKKEAIAAEQTKLNGLLAQDARQRNNQQTKSNV